MSDLNTVINSMWTMWAHNDETDFVGALGGLLDRQHHEEMKKRYPYGYNEYGAFEAPRYKENEDELERFNDIGLDDYYE